MQTMIELGGLFVPLWVARRRLPCWPRKGRCVGLPVVRNLRIRRW